MRQLHITSGGQTGVDQAAFDVARELDIPLGGHCQRHGKDESQQDVAERYNMKRTRSNIPAIRTQMNIRKSLGTMVIKIEPLPSDAIDGTKLTINYAHLQKRPTLLIDLDDDEKENIVSFRDWMQKYAIEDLNIGGPRESSAPGIYDRTVSFLRNALPVILALIEEENRLSEVEADEDDEAEAEPEPGPAKPAKQQHVSFEKEKERGPSPAPTMKVSASSGSFTAETERGSGGSIGDYLDVGLSAAAATGSQYTDPVAMSQGLPDSQGSLPMSQADSDSQPEMSQEGHDNDDKRDVYTHTNMASQPLASSGFFAHSQPPTHGNKASSATAAAAAVRVDQDNGGRPRSGSMEDNLSSPQQRKRLCRQPTPPEEFALQGAGASASDGQNQSGSSSARPW